MQADHVGAACRIGPKDMKNRLLPATRPVYDWVAPGKPNAADINPAEFTPTMIEDCAEPLRARCASWPPPGHAIVCNITLLREGRSE
jgi:hypothetical protein